MTRGGRGVPNPGGVGGASGVHLSRLPVPRPRRTGGSIVGTSSEISGGCLGRLLAVRTWSRAMSLNERTHEEVALSGPHSCSHEMLIRGVTSHVQVNEG